MPKLLLINSVCGIGSTGRICTDIAQEYEKNGYDVKIAYGREDVPQQFQKYAVRIGSDWDIKLHGVKARLFDTSGFGSKRATKRFIKWVKEFDPDVIHLHNIHGYYINIEILFDYLKNCGKRIIWTLHDCWAFTGHCAYFSMAKCEKWKTCCYNCSEKHRYPQSLFFDNSKKNYNKKKELFCNVNNMELIVPSEWLKEKVQKSFLFQYPISVVANKVNKEIFKPTSSDYRKKHQLEDKKIILGVASVWDKRKGLDDFIKLSKLIDDSYRIMLIGLSKKQIKKLPSNIYGLERTANEVELAKMYSMADVFVNLSREETFGMTTLESEFCGTPAIVYKDTACEEIACKYGGIAVEPDVVNVLNEIKRILKDE